MVALGLALVAVLSVWPAPQHPRTVLPTGVWAPGTVPMLNAWTIWWNADRLAHGLSGYWDAPIFHPELGTFAFSEPQPATWGVAPIVWLTGSPIPAYHVYLVGTLVLNGLFAVRLLRTLGVRWLAALAGGVAVLLLPLVHQNCEAMQLMSLWGGLWTFEALVKLHRRPSWRRGMVLGLAFSSVFMCCIHHGIFLALLLGSTGWITIPPRYWKRWLAGVVLAGATALLFLLPLLVPMRQILAAHEFARPASNVQSLSATSSAWLQTLPGALTDFAAPGGRSSRPLSPGWIRVGLAVAGVLLALRQRRHRRAIVFLAALGGCSLLWSFGMNLQIGNWHPWLALTEWVPGFSHVRSAYRFAYFAQLTAVLLGAFGLDRLSRLRWAAERGRRTRRAVYAILLVACAAVAFEVPPVPVRLATVPDVSVEPSWVAFLRQNTPENRSIVCLPFAAGYSAKDSEATGRWMLYGTRHRVAMVNGYSGFFPKSWYRLVEAFKTDPFGDKTLKMLVDAQVEYVVIDPRFLAENDSPATAAGHKLVRVFRDESGVEIWHLQ